MRSRVTPAKITGSGANSALAMIIKIRKKKKKQHNNFTRRTVEFFFPVQQLAAAPLFLHGVQEALGGFYILILNESTVHKLVPNTYNMYV